VAAAVGKHLFAALLAEGIEALAALLLQRVALGVAQLVAADQAVGAVAVGGDAVAGEHLPHHPFHAFGGVLDLGHVFAQDPPGHVLRWGGAAAAEQFHEHERLVDVAHSHLLGDVLPEALKGAGRRWGARAWGMLAAAEPLVQLWLLAARQEGAPAGIPSGVGAWRLQPSRLRVWLCRPSPQSMADDKRHTRP